MTPRTRTEQTAGGGRREEVLNVVLAELLREEGIASGPEQRVVQDGRSASPDVIVHYRGLRTAIEGKVDDQANAEAVVIGNATGRLEQGLAHVAIAAIYPARLRTVPFESLKSHLRMASLKLAVLTESGQQGWVDGDVAYLGAMLRRAFVELVQEDTVNSSVEVLRGGVTAFCDAVMPLTGACENMASLLGIGEPEHRAPEDESS